MTDRNAIMKGVEKAGRLAVVALGFSIPISVALDNVLLAVVVACYLAGGGYREKLARIASNPVMVAVLVLFSAMALSALHGTASGSDAARYLMKYSDLLFIPAIAAFFANPRTRRLGLYAFGAAIVTTLLISYARSAGLLPEVALLAIDPPYPVVFKHSLTHAVLIVFGALLSSVFAIYSHSPRARLTWSVIAALSVANVLFLVPGRTAYLILMALILYSGYAWGHWKGLVSMVAVAVVATIVTFNLSKPFQTRIHLALDQFASASPAVAATADNSIGLRMELYRNSLEILRKHPLVGVGTGGFPEAYAEQVRGTEKLAVQNPHNEYLMIAVQTGLAGLALLMYLFARQFMLAPRLADPLEAHLARGLVIAMAIGCLFNSFLLDHTEGLLYAWLTGLLYGGLQARPPA